jgi:transcriptional regulator with XRE-family HTH domain
MSRNAAAADDITTSADGWMTRLGPKLRALRKERELTLEAVADRAGLTKGFLSLVERGQTTISVPNLLKVCEILGVSVGSLFDYPESAVVRGGLGAPVEMGGSGIREYVLTPETERNLQVMRSVLKPGGGTGGAYTLDSETIFVFVVRGCLRLTVDGNESLLKSGDSYTFSARTVHSWDNPGAEESEVLWSIVPPIPRVSGPNRH